MTSLTMHKSEGHGPNGSFLTSAVGTKYVMELVEPIFLLAVLCLLQDDVDFPILDFHVVASLGMISLLLLVMQAILLALWSEYLHD